MCATRLLPGMGSKMDEDVEIPGGLLFALLVGRAAIGLYLGFGLGEGQAADRCIETCECPHKEVAP